MRRIWPWLGLLTVVAAGIGFSALNSGQRVRVDLWLVTFYRVPVTYVAFGGMMAGMIVVLLAGIRTDLKVRELLREKARLEIPRHPAAPLDRPLLPEPPEPAPESATPEDLGPPSIPETWEPPPR